MPLSKDPKKLPYEMLTAILRKALRSPEGIVIPLTSKQECTRYRHLLYHFMQITREAQADSLPIILSLQAELQGKQLTIERLPSHQLRASLKVSAFHSFAAQLAEESPELFTTEGRPTGKPSETSQPPHPSSGDIPYSLAED